MGYTLRQAVFATRLFNDDTEGGLLYLMDMDEHRDELEIQITQAELEEERERAEEERRKRREGTGGRWRRGKGAGDSPSNQGGWLRLFPRFTSSTPFSRASSQPQSGQSAGDEGKAGGEGGWGRTSHVPSPSPSVSPSLSPYVDVGVDESILSRVPPHRPNPSPPPRPTSPFACDVCTFLNSEGGECGMCGTVRPLTEMERVWESSLRSCGICFDAMPLSALATATSPCGHLYCPSCYHSYLLSRVEENRVLSICCPHPSCRRPVLDVEMRSVLSPYHYARYRRFHVAAQLEADPRVRYCPNRDCQAVLLGSADSPRMQCGVCGMESCYVCQIAWHVGLTCLQVLRHPHSLRGPTAEDVAFLQAMHAGGEMGEVKFRQCPRCSTWVERAAGCAKMTCRCGSQWCFECGILNATCNCTPRYHVFYPLHTVLSNWNNAGPG